MDCIIQTSELSKSFKGVKAVDRVNLHVNRGEIYGFIGQNGAGKTTTIRMVLGLIEPTGGTVELFGEKTSEQNRYRHLKKLGAIIEAPGFYLNLSGWENLDIHRIMMDVPDRSSVDRALKLVGLADEKNKRVRHYSLGMKQRLGLARALLHNPDLLILDEPTNGLDPQGIVEVRELLTELASQGKTIFVSSHILSEVEKMVNRIGILHKGILLEEISSEELRKKCGSWLQYRVSEPEKAVGLISRFLHTAQPSIDRDCITFDSTGIENSGTITKLLVENNIEVKESRIVNSSLEDYFIQLTGVNSHV